MNSKERRILQKLSADAALPREEFKEELLTKLLSDEDNQKHRKLTFMRNLKFVYPAAVGLIILAGVGIFLLNNNSQSEQVAQDDELPINASSQDAFGISLPSTQLESIEEAQQAVDFDLVIPDRQIQDETISLIEKIESFTGEDMDTIAIKYSEDGQTLYRVSQSRFIGAVDETAEEVVITFKGEEVTATFTQIMTLEEPDENSEQFAYGGDSTPSSFLSWEYDGIGYEISEFGQLNMEQLVDLAESMQ